MTGEGAKEQTLPLFGRSVPSGVRERIDVPLGRLASGVPLSLPIEVLNGSEAGPTIWLSGAIHGDEIVGVEVIRQVLDTLDPTGLRGAIVAAPVVNVFGFVFESRYLPDRRDLNRSFPGSRKGSLAARLARLFLDEVVANCDLGIDFHAGSDDRTNLPQIRGNMNDPETLRLALAFGAPVVIHAKPVRGSLRAAALKMGRRVLLFEGGEPRRFSPESVEAGTFGTLRTLHALGMIEEGPGEPPAAPVQSRRTRWTRASRGGVLRLATSLGSVVARGEQLGVITDPLSRNGVPVRSRSEGMVIGLTVNPLVSLGDAVVHVAEVAGSMEPATSPSEPAPDPSR